MFYDVKASNIVKCKEKADFLLAFLILIWYYSHDMQKQGTGCPVTDHASKRERAGVSRLRTQQGLLPGAAA